MSDIVERLRLQNDCLLGTGHDFSDVLLDAANEIERLREQLNLGETGAKALADAKEENARLRGELDAATLEVSRLERLVWTPMNAYPKIERLRKELAEKDDYIRTVSRPIGAHNYE